MSGVTSDARRGLVRGVGSALLIGAALAPVDAWADPTPSVDRALAETLFQEGKRLMGEGSYADACAKLAESQRLDPGGGTLLLLGLCHEQEGRTGSAWGELSEALALAVKETRADRKAVAEKHLAALEPRISRLTVRVPTELDALAGVEIARDGLVLGKAAWGVASPVDPGEHRVEARAPGKKTWSATVTVSAAADRVVLDVPLALEDAPVAPPPPVVGSRTELPPLAPSAGYAPARVDRSPPPADSASDRRAIGFAVGAVGVAAIGFGAYFGVRAVMKGGQVDEACPQGKCKDASGPSLNDEARAAADASTVSFVLGAVGLGVGTALVLTARPRGAATRARFAVAVSGSNAKVTGAW